MTKPAKASDSHGGKGKPDWFMMMEGVFANRSIVVASIIVILLGITVVALYFSHRNSEAPPALHDIDSSTQPGEKNDETTTSGTSAASDTDKPDSATSTDNPLDTTATTTSKQDIDLGAPKPPSDSVKPDSSSANTSTNSTLESTPSDKSVAADNAKGATEPKTQAQNSSRGKPASTPPSTKLNDSVKPSHKPPHSHHSTQGTSPAGHSVGHRHAYSSYEF
jgi:hypothetical protein